VSAVNNRYSAAITVWRVILAVIAISHPLITRSAISALAVHGVLFK